MAAPIVQMQIDYRRPLEFDQLFEIETVLYWCDAMKLTFEYCIRLLPDTVQSAGTNGDGDTDDRVKREHSDMIVATAATVQLLTDSQGTILLTESGFVKEFRDRWRRGDFVG